jgi:phosphatidylserine decarboxylase
VSLTTSVIRWFVGRYGVDMDEAVNPDVASYKSFNEFFTRPLKAGARPQAEAAFPLPGRWRDQPIRPDRARPDFPG